MRRLAVLTLLALSTVAPAHAGEATITETAAEECEEPGNVEEFGHGSVDRCYGAMVWEIAGARGVELFREEDGSGRLGAQTFPAGTFAWDCARDGNRICGPIVPVPVALAELPRTL